MDINKSFSYAVQQFWKIREKQIQKQQESGTKDKGNRGAVTGGAQLDGFIELMSVVLKENGILNSSIFVKSKVTLPGYFRPTKEWDLVAVDNGKLLAVIEFKSQVGPSFGNNFNNRVEEALGSALDIRTAYREGAFPPFPKPWLGYLMLLEDAPASTRPVACEEPHFPVFKEFRDASCAKRYEIFCERLLRENLYDAACLALTDRESGPRGEYRAPSPYFSPEGFISSLSARAAEFAHA
jgi:hypothetical protein